MAEAKKRWPVKIFAYCLMPNHFHMIIRPDQAENLSKWMQWLMTSHVRRYHEHHKTTGHVWQGRFKSFIIQNDKYLLSALRYVEANPVRSHLVNRAEEWPWSSHKESIGAIEHFVIDPIPMELPIDWNKCVNDVMSEEDILQLRQSIRRQSPYGTQDWKLSISNLLGLESTIRPMGRPRIIKK